MREKHSKNKKDMGLASEICIWKKGADCEGCNLENEVICTPHVKYSVYFGLPLLIAIIPVIIGLVFAGFYNPLVLALIFTGWIAYSLFFFFIWESRIICNHCPYYANDTQRTLHCPVDKGKLKTSKYDPGPMRLSEKIQFVIGATIFALYPLPFLLIAGQIIPIIFLLGGVIIWIIVIQLTICPYCVNFSCPLNRVPKSVRNEFLNLNPVIKKAWKEKGYVIE